MEKVNKIINPSDILRLRDLVKEVYLDEKIEQWNNEELSYQYYHGGYDDRNSDYNQTDWSNYNDDLDKDQQSIEFWNQF